MNLHVLAAIGLGLLVLGVFVMIGYVVYLLRDAEKG